MDAPGPLVLRTANLREEDEVLRILLTAGADVNLPTAAGVRSSTVTRMPGKSSASSSTSYCDDDVGEESLSEAAFLELFACCAASAAWYAQYYHTQCEALHDPSMG